MIENYLINSICTGWNFIKVNKGIPLLIAISLFNLIDLEIIKIFIRQQANLVNTVFCFQPLQISYTQLCTFRLHVKFMTKQHLISIKGIYIVFSSKKLFTTTNRERTYSV